MLRFSRLLVLALMWTLVGAASPARAQFEDVARELNAMGNTALEANKSYKILFDAYLDLTTPPMNVGVEFNALTIHNKMSQWPAVSEWAKANQNMGKAIIAVKTKEIIGLPYGLEGIDARYKNANLSVDLAPNGDLRNIQYGYLKAMETMTAYTVAEMYRLFEAGESKAAWDLGTSMMWVLRQQCDRVTLAEKQHGMRGLSNLLTTFRDMMYVFRDSMTKEDLVRVAVNEIPYLWPNDRRLAMPEGDQVIARKLLSLVFDESGQPDRDKFIETFSVLQSKKEPYTIFGAARRWGTIADVHGSLEASNLKLTAIYDDWWRRWRMSRGDFFTGSKTQFTITNHIRYAAVLFSLSDIQSLFDERPVLQVNINGTAISAGLVAFWKQIGTAPDRIEMVYGQTARKRSDLDPFESDYKPFIYKKLSAQTPINAPPGRVMLTGALLYSRGADLVDDSAVSHSPDGLTSDIVIWPPINALAREQGLLP